MSLTEEVEILRNVPMFARIPPAKLKLLAFASERIVFAAGEAVVRQGEPGDAAYILIDGEAEVLVTSGTDELRLATLGRNDIVGEIAILIDVPRTATVRAVTELVTLRISKELFFRMIDEFPQLAVEIMRELAHRLETTTARLRSVIASTPG